VSFDSMEVSVDLGEPINLYMFTYGPGDEDYYAYTDGESIYRLNVEGENIVFEPRQVRRSDIQSSGTTDKTTLEINLLNTDPVAEMFRVYPPSFPVGVVVWQAHVGSTVAALLWSGKVLSCSREGALSATLTCEPSSVSMRRIGLRRSYQYMCPHALYSVGDGLCNASKAAATIMIIPESVTGRQVLLGTEIANQQQYAGGLLEWVNDEGRTEYRTVLSVALVGGKTQLTLTGIARGLNAGDMAPLAKGCAHTMTACGSVHNNTPNYGGQPFIPTKNPLGRTTPFL
jgi:hypothetical protein